jgi:hypothetical protein
MSLTKGFHSTVCSSLLLWVITFFFSLGDYISYLKVSWVEGYKRFWYDDRWLEKLKL